MLSTGPIVDRDCGMSKDEREGMEYKFGGTELGTGDDGNDNPPGIGGMLGTGPIVDDACIDTEVLENITDVIPCE